MRYLPTIARLLLGLVFFVFGIAGLFNLIPPPKEGVPDLAVAMIKSGYLFQLIKVVEIVGGAMLLFNRFVPLGLTLLASIIVNIFAFHLFLDPKGMIIPIVIALLEIYLAWSYRQAFRPMLAARVTPGGAAS
jgi:uncharacterized membrane protein YphA (DoxX/SURF4 family)